MVHVTVGSSAQVCQGGGCRGEGEGILEETESKNSIRPIKSQAHKVMSHHTGFFSRLPLTGTAISLVDTVLSGPGGVFSLSVEFSLEEKEEPSESAQPCSRDAVWKVGSESLQRSSDCSWICEGDRTQEDRWRRSWGGGGREGEREGGRGEGGGEREEGGRDGGGVGEEGGREGGMEARGGRT